MFKIGDFSRLAQVSVRTLRHYDDLGLLEPAQIDRFTDYRYYSVEQLPRLNRILALKDLGFSLDQIGHLLNDNVPLEQLRGMLRLKQAEIEREVEEGQSRLARVAARLKMIEHEHTGSRYEVLVKPTPAMTIASIRHFAPTVNDMGPECFRQFMRMYAFLDRHRITPIEPELDLFHSLEYTEVNIDVETATAIERPAVVPAGGDLVIRELPAEPAAACVIHDGCWPDEIHAIQMLFIWCDANKMRITGPLRELHLSGRQPDLYSAPNVVMELQVPVQPAA